MRGTAENAGLVRRIGPQAIARTVALRLARLPEPAEPVVRAVAVLGDGADVDDRAALAGVEPAAVAAVAGPLARAEILTGDRTLRFVHPLVRDAVYEAIAPAERELEHARAADVMIAAGAADEAVAAQLLMTARRGESWVVDRLVAAARDRRGAGLARRRRLVPDPRPGGAAAGGAAPGAAAGARDGGVADQRAGRGRPLRAACAALDDPAARAAAAPALAQSLIFTGAPQEAAAFASQTAQELPAEYADLAEVLEAIELGTTMFGMSEPDQVARLRAYRERPVGPGPGPEDAGGADRVGVGARRRRRGRVRGAGPRGAGGRHDGAADNGFLTVPASTSCRWRTSTRRRPAGTGCCSGRPGPARCSRSRACTCGTA